MKKIINEVLSVLGYQIEKKNTGLPPVDLLFSNFKNLAQTYEKKMNRYEGDVVLSKNDVRIKLLARLRGTPPSEAYFLIKGLARTKELPGDICEFGVAQGETSLLLANEIINSEKKLHLFDSFQGLPVPSPKDVLKDDIFSLGKIESYKGTMAYSKNHVIERLHSIKFPENRYVIHEGFIENIIIKRTNFPHSVSFAYVDFDFYEPIKIVLQFLDEVTSSGAIIIVDDYNFFSEGVKTAVDEFMMLHQESYLFSIPDQEFGYFAIIEKI